MWLGREVPFVGGNFGGRVLALARALASGAEVVVTSYDFWARKPEDPAFAAEAQTLLEQGRFTILVLDEAHELANPSALRTRNLARVRLEGLKRILLTGTFVRNRVDSAAVPLCIFAFPGELRLSGGRKPESLAEGVFDGRAYRRPSPEFGPVEAFIRKYAVLGLRGKVLGGKNLDPETCVGCRLSRCFNVPPGEYDWFGTGRCRFLYLPPEEKARVCTRCPVYPDGHVPEECRACPLPLSNKLRNLGARVLRAEDVLGRAPVMAQVERVRFDEAQHELYRAVQNGVVAWRDARRGGIKTVTYATKLAVLTALRLAALEPEQWAEGVRRAYADLKNFLTEEAFGRRVPSAKLGWLKEFLRGLGREKTAVFMEFKTTARVWAKALGEQAAAFTGDETPRERAALLERWAHDDNLKVLLCTSAAFLGIDLSAGGRAKYAVIAHPFWQPAAARQAAERVFHPELSDGVLVIHLVSEGVCGEETVEALVHRRMTAKAADGRRAAGLVPDLDVLGVSPQDIDAIIQSLKEWK
jgi:hypothetical protein